VGGWLVSEVFYEVWGDDRVSEDLLKITDIAKSHEDQ
jgi:hypothetical protein